MGAIITQILKVAIQVLAGVGIGALADKVAADKLPAYPEGGLKLHSDEGGGVNIPRVVYIVLAFAVGAVLLKFVGRKLKINLLK